MFPPQKNKETKTNKQKKLFPKNEKINTKAQKVNKSSNEDVLSTVEARLKSSPTIELQRRGGRGTKLCHLQRCGWT